jgi:hypothetical protein
MSQVVRVKGMPIELSGEIKVIPPLSLGALEHLLPRINEFKGDASNLDDIKVVADCAWAALKRNYPEMTREEVAEAIGLENFLDVMTAIMDVSGLKRKAAEEAAAAEAGEA